MIRKIIPLIVVMIISNEIPLQPEVFKTEIFETYQNESVILETPVPTPVITPTVAPGSARFGSTQANPTVTPTPAPRPTQEPYSPPKGKYVEGFGYVEYSGPNQCEVVDSDGDINKMVGYMGDAPERAPVPAHKEEYIPKNGDKEIDFQTGEVKIYVEGQGFVPAD